MTGLMIAFCNVQCDLTNKVQLNEDYKEIY